MLNRPFWCIWILNCLHHPFLIKGVILWIWNLLWRCILYNLCRFVRFRCSVGLRSNDSAVLVMCAALQWIRFVLLALGSSPSVQERESNKKMWKRESVWVNSWERRLDSEERTRAFTAFNSTSCRMKLPEMVFFLPILFPLTHPLWLAFFV